MNRREWQRFEGRESELIIFFGSAANQIVIYTQQLHFHAPKQAKRGVTAVV